MIQRIQSLYLFLIALLSGITLFSPVVRFFSLNPDFKEVYVLTYDGLRGGESVPFTDTSLWFLTILLTTSALLAFVTIFLYKKRTLQISLTVANMILLIGYYVLLSITVWTMCAEDALNADFTLNIVASFPLISLILCYLVIRAIVKDEALVRSLNRLR